MKHIKFSKLSLIIALLFFINLSVFSQQISVDSTWIPPSPRLKNWTLFEPKPTNGNNIFENEADVWLADAIVEIETDGFRPIKDQAVKDYVSKIGVNLAIYSTNPKKAYEFIVVDDNNINAMNAGGGRIYVNLGMLKSVESEDELAGVIAHEIAHDSFCHAAKTVTRQLFWIVGTKKVKTKEEVFTALEALLEEYEKKPLAAVSEGLFGIRRIDELEADRAAFYNIYKAGYNPYALSVLLKKMQARNEKATEKSDLGDQILRILFGSHPPTSQRSTAISWESNFVKMPKKDNFHKNTAFDEMKAKVDKL
jgi:beta-barrel assembly-enhancing protease